MPPVHTSNFYTIGVFFCDSLKLQPMFLSQRSQTFCQAFVHLYVNRNFYMTLHDPIKMLIMHFNQYGWNVCRKALCVNIVPLLSALECVWVFFVFFKTMQLQPCNLDHGCKSQGSHEMISWWWYEVSDTWPCWLVKYESSYLNFFFHPSHFVPFLLIKRKRDKHGLTLDPNLL